MNLEIHFMLGEFIRCHLDELVLALGSYHSDTHWVCRLDFAQRGTNTDAVDHHISVPGPLGGVSLLSYQRLRMLSERAVHRLVLHRHHVVVGQRLAVW